MRRLALRLVADEHCADDVVQNTWLELVERPPREQNALAGWLKTVVRSFAAKSGRERDRRRRRELASAPPRGLTQAPSPTPEALLERMELHQKLLALVRELREPYRSTIVLRYFDDLSPPEIARLQKAPVTTVRSRLHHALDLLRSRLDQEHGGERRAWRMLLFPVISPAAQHALAVSAAAPSTGACAAGFGAAAGWGGGAKMALMAGATLMSNKAALSFGVAGLLTVLAGVGVWYASEGGARRAPTVDRAVEESPASRQLAARLKAAQTELDASREENHRLLARQGELEKELREVQQKDREKTADAAAADGAAVATAASELRWDELSSLIAGNLEILGKLSRSERLSDEEQVTLNLLFGELMKLSSRAKRASKTPIFDREIFTGLVSALYRDSLQLTPEQKVELERLCGSLFDGLPEDAGKLPPLQRYQLRKDMLARLEAETEGMLNEEQREAWQAVRHFSRNAFSAGGEMKFGLAGNPKSFLSNWSGNALEKSLDGETSQRVLPVAEAFLRDADAALRRRAQTNEELKALPEAEKAALETEILRLQEEFHRQAEGQLGDELRERLRSKDPMIIHFDFANGVSIMGRHSYF